MSLDQARVAVVSSPRSGNSWLRWLIRDALGLTELAVHNYANMPPLPDRCVLQTHWYREPNFQQFLRTNGFQIIVIARHPLDILVSALHFIRYEPETAQWLGGNCAIPSSLVGCSPGSREFLDYALGFGAENMLSITYQWWHDEDAIKLRYEDLVGDTSGQLRAVIDRIAPGWSSDNRITGIDHFPAFRAMPNRHGWQGRPGLWEKLIPSTAAEAIYRRHRSVFDHLGYRVPLSELNTTSADRNWAALVA